jgi:hypothetical protein
MVIRAVSVFEGVVYHCYATDTSAPCQPTLEVEAGVRDGDVDAGPLLVSLADYITLAGGPEVARPCLAKLEAKGRIVSHLGSPHVSFPMWTPVDLERR